MADIRAVMASEIESTTMSKVTWRLVPFLGPTSLSELEHPEYLA